MAVSNSTVSPSSPTSHILSCLRITRRRCCVSRSLCTSRPLSFGRRNTCALVLAMEARENLNTQDKSDRLTTATGNLFEDTMANYHPSGVAGEVAGHPIPLRRSIDGRFLGRAGLCFERLLKILAALLRKRNTSALVLAMEAREGPNNRDPAGCLLAATGHHLKDMMATNDQPGIFDKIAGRVHDGRKCWHTLAPSVLQARHFWSPGV